jgi:anaerobic magnesium-protoporphyrin IX monomethyl ester cyclase
MKNQVVILYGIPPVNLKDLQEFGFAIPPCIPKFMKKLANTTKFIFSGFQTLGAIAVASYLKDNGVNIETQDFYVDPVDVSTAGIVGISSTFMDLKDVNEITEYIKERNPEATLILGGPISWSYPPEKIMSEIPDLEAIILREGERTFLHLIKKIQNDEPLSQISGIAYKSGNKVKKTSPPTFIEGNEFPRPDWNLVDLAKRMPILPIETSRGCIYKCAFCSETTYWPKPVRLKPVNKITEELKNNIKEFNIKTFRFVDSCFTAPQKRCAKICDAIIEEDLDIKWTSYARIDNMSSELLQKMKQSGCVSVDIGMESGDPTILRRMEKNYTPKDIIESINAAKEVDIITHCNLVVGFPGETAETIGNTINTIEKAQPDTYDAYLLDLAPHTKIYNHAEMFGIQGNRLMWRHKTMDTKQAMIQIHRIYATVSASHPFLGGEYFAGVLTSFGYNTHQIRTFFSTFHDLYKNPKAEPTPEFEKISEDIKKFIVPWKNKRD